MKEWIVYYETEVGKFKTQMWGFTREEVFGILVCSVRRVVDAVEAIANQPEWADEYTWC